MNKVYKNTCVFCFKEFESNSNGESCKEHYQFIAQINKYKDFLRHAEMFSDKINIPKRYKNAQLNEIRHESNGHINLIKFIMANSYTENIFIHGPVGCGKTIICSAAINNIIRSGRWARYDRAIDLISEFRGIVSNDTTEQNIIRKIKEIINGGIFFIDDIGAEKTTDFSLQCMYMLIDSFYNDNQSVIFTSNLNPAELAGAMGDRIASRICSGKIFKLDGPDGRIKK